MDSERQLARQSVPTRVILNRPVPLRFPTFAPAAVLAVLSVACGPSGGAPADAAAPVASPPAVAAAPTAPSCEPFSETAGPLPQVDAKHLTLQYWLEQLGHQYDLDQVLLTPEQIGTLNAALDVPREAYHSQHDLLAPLDMAELTKEVGERREWARAKLSAGEYVTAAGAPLSPALFAILDHEPQLQIAEPELRVTLGDAQIHCAPIAESFYSPSLDLRLDRNACSGLRPQEVVRVVARWPNGMQLVEAAYSFGWLRADVPLSPPIPAALRQAFVRGTSLQVHGGELLIGEGENTTRVAEGSTLPAAGKRRRVHVATPRGFVLSSTEQAKLLRPTRRGLTRRALLSEAWRFIGTPYGLGDTDGGRDCSRLVLDVFDSFDLRLPRHSSWQAQAGSFWIDIDGVPEADRPLLFDAAARKGIVLLHFPGHVMLYLGRNERGVPMVLHALGEYAEPCPSVAGQPGRGERLVRVKNVTVSDLELGRATSRTALLERVQRITVIGGTPGIELGGVAQLRPVADAKIPADRHCQDSEQSALYVMPEQPNKQQPLRVVSVVSDDPGPAALTLVDPDGQRIRPPVVRLGGPPFGQVATVAAPKPGRWKAVLADGQNVLSCQTITVRKRRPELAEPDGGPIWQPKYRWNIANENLYALFVERLFDHPIAEERVWPSLHPLLRDGERNILFDYRGLDEDNAIELAPDCADLPYALRSYFAWKMRLPFGYRRCSRGRAGKPPRCDVPGARDNLMSRFELRGKGGQMQPRDDIEAFELFANTELRSGVHSSSGRTLPDDDLTDFYPVPLTRESLRPGTVFADPYGHFLVLSDWVPQRADGYGLLVAVDAQPDGTVGQRRFWRGSFLFDPNTKSGGAGFKAFRPRLFVEEPYTLPLGAEPEPRPKGGAIEPISAGVLPGPGGVAAVPVPAPPGIDTAAATPAPVPPLAGAAGADPGSSNVEVAEAPPLIERIGFLEDVENKELRRTRRYTPLSLQQYKGSADDFYASVESLINPRPLEARVLLRALVDALQESVQRRVLSVNNGEEWLAEHPGEVIEMPEADAIFLSTGPWEDFSTPSRDLRLLIAIDTVMNFEKSVRMAPARFGLPPGDAAELERKLLELKASLDAELRGRSFRYTRSDGSAQQLSLADVVTRRVSFEVAYNPNDCSEVRWGAPPGSPEMASCQRRAPPDQQGKLDSYRHWFATRKRPPQ
jgi:hypothetical protein